MANSDELREGIQSFLQKKASKRLRNTLFNVMPTLEFLFAMNGGSNKDGIGLGRPKSTGVMVGIHNGVANSRRESIFAEREYKIIRQHYAPPTSEVKNMDDYDSNPVVPSWDTDNRTIEWVSQPRVKFTRKKIPYKVAHSATRTVIKSARTEGEAVAAIGSVYDLEVKTRMAVLCKLLNQELWGTAGQQGYPTNEDAVTWDHMHSLASAMAADNTYLGVDRSLSANASFRGNTISTPMTMTFEDLINYCNYDLGMIDVGLGVQVIAVGKTLMKKAKAEAKTEGYKMMSDGIPEYPEFGFKREVVRIWSGNRPTYIYYDPECPAGVAACLDPSTITVAIHPDSDFKISVPADQEKVEGGDEADTGTIAVEIMIAFEEPKGNAYFTALS